MLEDISKCIVANNYEGQLIKIHSGRLTSESGTENIVSSGRRERPQPLFFNPEISYFKHNTSKVEEVCNQHKVTPIFIPRALLTKESRYEYNLVKAKVNRNKVFEEFLIIERHGKETMNVFQYPNLPVNANWYYLIT